ncbi:IclR family transcriptional regulator [Actinopolymorpha pittospori]|uniref:DNA-binding IclR family transcriptional regulator n=1 Tax=Actinopolymorpha pittospori TaxID=648752 RepID=A0A927N618_9ACTN|nr:helix-turn-helix domain-containing protein [Actinopolymorpha pittospori]MBE1613091.1 DNA-binding IclR family transcriptional regulator [Actinopolymorpha pittospori]
MRPTGPTGSVSSGIQALMRGLDTLRLLVESGRPMSPTELAEAVGVHQSSVSRILSTLATAGYVRKVAGRRFEPDFGVLTLASAVTAFPLVRKPRAAMAEAASMCPGCLISLSILWRGQILYFLRTVQGEETVDFWGTGFPLHQSAPGMRMLLELPEQDALEMLAMSRVRHGWPRGSDATPATEVEALERARALFDHDILIIDDWHEPDRFGAATLIDYPGDHPVALSLAGPREVATDDKVRLWLLQIRRAVEKSLQ